LDINHYSSTPRLHYSKLLSELKCLKLKKEHWRQKTEYRRMSRKELLDDK